MNPTETQRDFLTVALDLGMLDAESAASLKRQSAEGGLELSRLAQRNGLLTAVQVDIVETLQRPGDAAPGFEILGVIGHGGMGVVYRARQRNLDRPVALKTVLLSQMNDPNFAARFEQEAMAVGRLRHPHIVAAYDFGRHDGRLYLAMELFEGEDADGCVKRQGPFSERIAWAIARQTASGLAHAAAAGIVHRDIKPANLLLAPAPEGYSLPPGAPMVKIADFGLAFLAQQDDSRTRLTNANAVIGSPHYMAPEQLGGEKVDLRADIYSLGASVWHLIAGQPPFDEPNVSRIVVRKLSEEPPSLRAACPHVSAETDALVAKMLSREPSKRFATYGELLAHIDSLLTGELPASADESIASRKTGLISDSLFLSKSDRDSVVPAETAIFPRAESPTAPKPRRRKPLILGAGALLLAIACAAAFLLWPRGLPQDRVLDGSRWSSNLFNGKSLRGWRIETGVWRIENSPEGLVMSGAKGSIRRPVYREAAGGRRLLKNYRVTLVAQLHQAKSIELHFGIRPDQDAHALRLDAAATTLGFKAQPTAPFEIKESPRRFVASDAELPHVIHIERQPENWWIFVDEKLAGVAAGGEGELPEFRLLVDGGPAWFSDIALEELVARE